MLVDGEGLLDVRVPIADEIAPGEAVVAVQGRIDAVLLPQPRDQHQIAEQRGHGVHVRRVDPYPALFQLLQTRRDIGHPRHRHVFDRAGRRLCHGVAQRSRAPLGDHHAVRPGSLRAAQDRAEIVRVLHLVADQQKRRFVPRRRKRENVVERRVRVRRRERRHALMVGVTAGIGQFLFVHFLDHDVFFAAQTHDLADGAGALAARDPYAVDGAAALQRFQHGVPSDDQIGLRALVFLHTRDPF